MARFLPIFKGGGSNSYGYGSGGYRGSSHGNSGYGNNIRYPNSYGVGATDGVNRYTIPLLIPAATGAVVVDAAAVPVDPTNRYKCPPEFRGLMYDSFTFCAKDIPHLMH